MYTKALLMLLFLYFMMEALLLGVNNMRMEFRASQGLLIHLSGASTCLADLPTAHPRIYRGSSFSVIEVDRRAGAHRRSSSKFIADR